MHSQQFREIGFALVDKFEHEIFSTKDTNERRNAKILLHENGKTCGFFRFSGSSDASVYIPAIINDLSEHKNKFVVLKYVQLTEYV
jgi:hypothetical protein